MQQISKPTFKQVYESYGLNMDDLTGPNKLYHTSIVQMLNGKPVLKAYALRVLGMLSERTGKQFTLGNVAVVLMQIDTES